MDSNNKPINEVRRSNRAVYDEAWIKAFLRQAPVGMLGTDWQGQPFVKPTLYVYDEASRALYFHGAREGRTFTSLETNPRSSFCVYEMGRLLPGKKATEFGLEYASVVVYGKVTLLADEAQAIRALQLLMDKYFPDYKPGRDYPPILPEDTQDTAVYRFEIESWSGKHRQADPQAPGAFFFPGGGWTHAQG